MTWTATVRLAIEAETDEAASAIADAVLKQMDVPVTSTRPDPSAAAPDRSKSLVIQLDLTGLARVEPDDAATRMKYVIRNLQGVIWQVAENTGQRLRYGWPSSHAEGHRRRHVLVHPAVRAAVIEMHANPHQHPDHRDEV